MQEQFTWARAHTNIALVKYWGKLDEKLIIPQNSSLSLTLDHFYTDTGVWFTNQINDDQLFIDDVKQPVAAKVKTCLDVIRTMAKIDTRAIVRSYNHVPNSAGLASSASAFAALATAACHAAGLKLSKKQLSMIARRGSGSATRSIFGGFVEWHGGNSNETSYAIDVNPPSPMDIKMITVVLNRQPKKISSRTGMKASVKTSPYYPAWKKQAASDLKAIKVAIQNNDFATLGHIAETNAMRMHALTLSADPSFNYFNADSLSAIDLVQSLRTSGIDCYFTMDAGPNVKVLCQSKDEALIINKLRTIFNADDIVVCNPGPGVTIIKDPR